MLPSHKYALGAFVIASALMLGGQALAQSTQDMSILTEQERQAFHERLQMSPTSATRAKITAEIRRLVQERRIELARQKADSELHNATPPK